MAAFSVFIALLTRNMYVKMTTGSVFVLTWQQMVTRTRQLPVLFMLKRVVQTATTALYKLHSKVDHAGSVLWKPGGLMFLFMYEL